MFPFQPFSSSSFQPFCEVIPICTNTQSWLWNEHFPALSTPPFSTPIYTQRKVPCVSYEDRETFLKAISPSQLGAAWPAVFSCCAPPHLFASLLTLGGLQGIAVFPLISSTSKRYQHYFCCQLCLCDRLWTIWMSLHLAAIKAPRFRTPHLGLSTPHGAELASPRRSALLHEHQTTSQNPITTSQNPISTSLEHQAGEEMLWSNLRVGMCSVIESLPNKLQQRTQIILKEQTRTVFGVMYQRKVTDRERMLKKKVVTSIMQKRNRNCRFLHVSFICNSPQDGNLFHQGRGEFVACQQMKSQSSTSRKVWWGWSKAAWGYGADTCLAMCGMGKALE